MFKALFYSLICKTCKQSWTSTSREMNTRVVGCLFVFHVHFWNVWPFVSSPPTGRRRKYCCLLWSRSTASNRPWTPSWSTSRSCASRASPTCPSYPERKRKNTPVCHLGYKSAAGTAYVSRVHSFSSECSLLGCCHGKPMWSPIGSWALTSACTRSSTPWVIAHPDRAPFKSLN